MACVQQLQHSDERTLNNTIPVLVEHKTCRLSYASCHRLPALDATVICQHVLDLSGGSYN